MQQLFLNLCNRDGAAGSIGGEESLKHLKYSAPSPFQAGLSGENSQAWAHLLGSLEDESIRNIFIGPEDVPPDLQSEHRDILRNILERRESGLSSVTIGDVPSETARLLAEAFQSARKIGELKFTGARADDALAKLLGICIRPVWVKHPSLRCLVVANHVRNLLTDKGAVTIAQALEENTCLQTLVLFGTLMGDGTARAIAAAMENNTSLQALVFYGKALSGKGTSAFAKWIKAGNFTLKELVIGGSEFGDEDAQALVREIVDRKKVDTSQPLQSFGLLNVNLGDGVVPALSALAVSGLAEVSILAGQLSDDGATMIARRAFGLKHSKSRPVAADATGAAHLAYYDIEPLRAFRLATSAAGNVGLKEIAEAWTEGNAPASCDLAFGNASIDVCEDMMRDINASDALMQGLALRSTASSSTAPIPASASLLVGSSDPTGCSWLCNSRQVRNTNSERDDGKPRNAEWRMNATQDIPSYLEEVLFPKLMLREVSPPQAM